MHRCDRFLDLALINVVLVRGRLSFIKYMTYIMHSYVIDQEDF